MRKNIEEEIILSGIGFDVESRSVGNWKEKGLS